MALKAIEGKLSVMTSIVLFMLQARHWRDQVSAPKHMRFQ